MGQVKVLSFVEDPKNPHRQILKVSAMGYCQHNRSDGTRLELIDGQMVVPRLQKVLIRI